MAARFFRKAALEKLSTPEKLDQLIQITGPKSWLSLLAIGLIIGIALIWGSLGTVKTKLSASGILVGGEVYDIVSTAQGQLIDLPIELGDTINEGDVIAYVDQPDLSQQIEAARNELLDREHEFKQLRLFGHRDTYIQNELITQQRNSINAQMESNYTSIEFYEQQLVIEKNLLEQGLITSPQVVSTEQRIQNLRNNNESLKAQLVQTSSQEHSISFDKTQQLRVAKQRIDQADLHLKQLQERYKKMSEIRSPYSGEVVEVLSDAGIVIGAGSPLFKLQTSRTVEGNLSGVLYIPSRDGKKIKVGMEALVVPSTVQPQEFGFIKAKVTHVSEFPVTRQGMMTSMKNDQLVQSLLTMGAPFEVFVEFERDSSSYSGYQWTSAKGPEVQVREGTSCLGRITVKQERPLTMVIPALKKFFDLY